MMQAHYRSTLDVTEKGLEAAEKGMGRLLEGISLLNKLPSSTSSSVDINALLDSFDKAIRDDFNAPILIANLFEAVRYINLINDGKETISKDDLIKLTGAMSTFFYDILGISSEDKSQDNRLEPVMDLVINLRDQAREQKDWTTSDKIRDGLSAAGIIVKDSKDGTKWS